MTRILSGLVFCLSLSGCLNFKHVHLMEHYAEKPASILILPIRNETTEEKAALLLHTTLQTLLVDRGYYVFPMQTVEQVVHLRGYRHAAELHEIPTDIVASWFHSDAVLYVTIRQWEVSLEDAQARTSVEVSYRMISGTTGALLWYDEVKHPYPTSLPDAEVPQPSYTAARLSETQLRTLAADINQRGFHFKNESADYDGPVLPPGPYNRHYQSFYNSIPGTYLPREPK